jgi:hypothetical protein
VEGTYGKVAHKSFTEEFRPVWAYRALGVTVFFARDGALVEAIRFAPPAAEPPARRKAGASPPPAGDPAARAPADAAAPPRSPATAAPASPPPPASGR